MPAPTPSYSSLVFHIRGYAFHIHRRYAEGVVITAGEAQALNQLLVENIRSNVDQWVQSAAAEAAAAGAAAEAVESTLSAETLTALQQRISEYEQHYEFVERPRRNWQSPLEREAALIVYEQAAEGEKLLTQQEIDEKILSPAVQALARKRLAQRKALSQLPLADLL